MGAVGSIFPSGSSPHTRGALAAFDVPIYLTGIIPAYAGSTRPPRHRDRTVADHPRIRGEHHPEDPHQGRSRGSSPHTRGAHVLTDGQRLHERIIPAYAGSTRQTLAQLC